MNNKIKVFENTEFGSVRTMAINGEPWFVASDVCKALDIGNPSQAISRLDDDEKVTLTTNEGHSGKLGGAQMLNVISEAGLYSLILKSRKPEAKAFKRERSSFRLIGNRSSFLSTGAAYRSHCENGVKTTDYDKQYDF